jgi:hypothetical protein
VHLTDLGKAHLELTAALGLLEMERKENDALRSELARVNAEKWFVTDLDKVRQERDEWRQCAERLAKPSSHELRIIALEEFDRLQAKST